MAPGVGYRLAFTGIVGALLATISALSLAKFQEADWFTQGGPYESTWVGYNKEQFVGAVFFTFFTPVAFTLLFVFVQQTIRWFANDKLIQVIIVSASISALLAGVILSSFWAHELFQCMGVGCVDPDKFPPPEQSRPEAGIGWQTNIGASGVFCFGFFAVAIVLSFLTDTFGIKFWSPFAPSAEHPLVTQNPLVADEHLNESLLHKKANNAPLHLFRESLGTKLSLYAVVFIFLFFFAFSTTYIPNSWEYFTANRIASFSSQNVSRTDCAWGVSSCPELPDAVFRTTNVYLTDWWILKLYPSNLVFFVYLMVVPLLGLIALSIPLTKTWMLRKVSIRFPKKTFHTLYLSVGEILMFLLFSTLVIIWTYYWWHDHNYNGNWPSGNILESERSARSLGQVAVLFMGLAFVPASRLPLMSYFFGVSWEAGIRYHRWIGILFLGASFGHMVANYVWIAKQGSFPHDIMSIPMSLPSSVDNWTVPLISLTFWVSFVLLCLGVFRKVRRRYFELFYYSHHVAYCLLIPTVLWHAAAGWEFLLPGVSIWFFDRVIRAYRSAQAVEVIKLNTVHCGTAGDITQIVCRPNFTYYPGQYCFINVAELSLFEWHPFTIASASSSELSFDIKSMGARTFSGRLFDMIHTKKGLDASGSLTISIDGPYGKAIDYTEYSKIYFIAGGIGVTPIKSIFSTLFAHYFTANSTLRNLSQVHFIWISREASLFNLMEDTLMQLPKGPFSAHLFATESASQGSDSDLLTRLRSTSPSTNSQYKTDQGSGITLSMGRPDLHVELNVANFEPKTNKTLVFACGPSKLLRDCEDVALQNNWHFHKEIFEL